MKSFEEVASHKAQERPEKKSIGNGRA